MGRFKGLLIGFALTALFVAIIVRVPKIKGIVFGADASS